MQLAVLFVARFGCFAVVALVYEGGGEGKREKICVERITFNEGGGGTI